VDTSSGDAAAGEILSGKKAWVQGAEVTGALATRTPDAGTVEQAAGFYEAFRLSDVDTDLNSANIRAGTTVFGVSGDPNVVDTSSGDAGAGDILIGKKAWVDGGEVTGTAYPAPVAKTGQTTCYDINGVSIDCGSPVFAGQDGEYQKGVTPPSPRFTDNGNGTVTDNLTGLIWLQNGNCADTVGGVTGPSMNWSQALAFCGDLANGDCDLTDGSAIGDWRLPNVKELLSLVHYDPSVTTLPQPPFSNVSMGYYWTSTASKSEDGGAFAVGFSGAMNTRDMILDTGSILAVRGGS
jgi:hypothetical protein